MSDEYDIDKNYLASASTELSEDHQDILQDLMFPLELYHCLVYYGASPERLFTFDKESKRDQYVEMVVENPDVEKVEIISNAMNYTHEEDALFTVH